MKRQQDSRETEMDKPGAKRQRQIPPDSLDSSLDNQRHGQCTNGNSPSEETSNDSSSPSEETSNDRIHAPTRFDIMLGRGRPTQNHPGNQHMREVVDRYRARYDTAERETKRPIVEEVMDEIKRDGGRFLRRKEDEKAGDGDEEDFWVEVNFPVAFEKVSHAFRSKRRTTSQTPDPSVDANQPVARLPAPVSAMSAPAHSMESNHQALMNSIAGSIGPALTQRQALQMRALSTLQDLSLHFASKPLGLMSQDPLSNLRIGVPGMDRLVASDAVLRGLLLESEIRNSLLQGTQNTSHLQFPNFQLPSTRPRPPV
jgi:hypothetical protein